MPELKAIQAKYKDDKQRQQQEMMKFYKENNVNPFASCLPLVAQLPVFISLFYMLREDLRPDICPRGPDGLRDAAGHTGTTACGPHNGARFPLHPGPDQQGDRADADRPDRPVRRHPAGVHADDVQPDDGQDAAADDDVPAAGLRVLHHQLPGGPDRLLDHHQHVDDGPAVLHKESDRSTSAIACARRRWPRTGVVAARTATRDRTAPAAGGWEASCVRRGRRRRSSPTPARPGPRCRTRPSNRTSPRTRKRCPWPVPAARHRATAPAA